jgi:hypothetical protein
MSSNQKHSSLGWTLAISLGIACSAGVVHAGNVSGTFTTGDTLTATKMTEIQGAVNDNDTRITGVINNTQAGTLKTEVDKITGIINNTQAGSLKTTVDGHTTSIANLEGGVPAATCAGNNTSDIMVRAGSVCVDKYEATLWPDKTSAGTTPELANTCNVDGSDCTYVAQSRTGVLPTVSISLYQAAAACANAGKRLLTNAEWQMAALGTVAANCNTATSTLANTNANPTCTSSATAINMVGNAVEWVGDMALVDGTTGAGGLSGTTRGGDAGDFGAANAYYLDAAVVANTIDALRGFRCAR